jgi:hypothetical protein
VRRLQLSDEPDVALPEPKELAVERLDLLPPGRGPEAQPGQSLAFLVLEPVADMITSWSCMLALSAALTCPDVGTNDVSEAGARDIGAVFVTSVTSVTPLEITSHPRTRTCSSVTSMTARKGLWIIGVLRGLVGVEGGR